MFPAGVKFNTASFAILIILACIFGYGNLTDQHGDIIRSFGVSRYSPYFTWLSYAFVHGGFLHILMNLIVLYYILAFRYKQNFVKKYKIGQILRIQVIKIE